MVVVVPQAMPQVVPRMVQQTEINIAAITPDYPLPPSVVAAVPRRSLVVVLKRDRDAPKTAAVATGRGPVHLQNTIADYR